MITILSGSARKNSNTLKVSKAINLLLKELNEDSKVIDFNGYDVPNFNQDFDGGNLSAWQTNAVDSMIQSHLVFFVSPEYNWMPTAEMMQFINRFGGGQFAHLWENKTFATVGLSSGIGGRLPALTLKNVIDEVVSFLGVDAKTVSGLQEVHHVAQVIDEEGNLLDNELFNVSFKSFVARVVKQAK
jgi:chromate reductase